MADSDKAPAPTSSDEIVALLVDGWNRHGRPETGSPYDEIMLDVQERTAATGSLGKSDIGALLLWKRLNLSSPWTRALNDTPEAVVREITRRAIEQANDPDLPIPEAARIGRETLVALPGCRSDHPVASTLLVAGAPKRMAVYDRRALNALELLGLTRPRRYSKYMAAVCELVELVGEAGHAWTPREVDMALFMLGHEDSSLGRRHSSSGEVK